MEESVDLSGLKDVQGSASCWDLAASFLEQRTLTELHFELVIDE